MRDEYLDILDVNGDLTGEIKTRSEVHAQGFWHRTVHIYFYRQVPNSVELIVHLRSKDKDLKPNRWDTRFGGHVKSGQSLESAIATEIQEETGLDIDTSKLFIGPVYKRDKFPNREFTSTYFYKYDKEINDIVFKDSEVQEVKWMNIDDIIESMKQSPDDWSSTIEGVSQIKDFIFSKLI